MFSAYTNRQFKWKLNSDVTYSLTSNPTESRSVVSTWIRDNLWQVYPPGVYPSHSGPLSLAIPPWVSAMSTRDGLAISGKKQRVFSSIYIYIYMPCRRNYKNAYLTVYISWPLSATAVVLRESKAKPTVLQNVSDHVDMTTKCRVMQRCQAEPIEDWQASSTVNSCRNLPATFTTQISSIKG